MEAKKMRAEFAICAALFIAAAVLTAAFSHYDRAKGAADISGRVVLSEILASNRTYPDENGRLLDFIELRNLTGDPIDISGYKLSDDGVSIGYTFPSGTVLPADGYALCWCDKDSGSGEYADFGISRKGGDTVTLFNSANVIVDKITVPHMDANVPLVRLDDGGWGTAEHASPGYENSPAGYEAWLHAMGGDEIHVVISEVQPANSCTAVDGAEIFTDWVELLNTGDAAAVLSGAYLSNDPADRAKWPIPELTLAPGESAVIRCAGSGAGQGEADFALAKEGCTVVLTGRLGNIISRVECPGLEYDHAWALYEDGSYGDTAQATPGFANTDAGLDEYLRKFDSLLPGVVISEVQTGNRSCITDASGRLCDWVELLNSGDSTAVLDGAYLSDDPESRAGWRIPSLSLGPGERAVIPCSGAGAALGEADFRLSSKGCTLTLTGRAGNILDSVDCPAMDADRVWALQADGEYRQTDLPTPGFENTREGRAAYLETQLPAGKLVISEVMPANNRYLRQRDGKYYDWLELYNASGEDIELSGYSLSDNADRPDMFTLPARTLAPGGRVVVICSGNAGLDADIRAPFNISREEDVVYLTGPDGRLSDYIRVCDVPYGCSVGRAADTGAARYFARPTPNAGNPEGTAEVSAPPELLTAGGVYNGVKNVKVELRAQGEVRYTLDGSEPDAASAVYTGPITLERTAVLRAACFEEGKLPSGVVSASYIINENHTLPVMSVAAEPSQLFGGKGIYTRSLAHVEVPCSFELFEDGGSFAIDCGLELYGHMGLKNPKKNFKVNFRGVYGSDVLSYPVYGEDGPQIYDALCMRAGQDYPMSIFREELFASLASQMGDNVLVQRSKFCILYVNGEYFGIYCLKEAFNENYYAQNHQVSEESVTVLQAPVAMGSELFPLISFCYHNDMSVEENYEYVASKVDIDSLIDWMIIEGYSTNGDVQQNLRYFKSTENGNKWQLALYDLDWAFYYHSPFGSILSIKRSLQHMGLSYHLMENSVFREKFLSRLSETLETTLSNENVIATIDSYEELLSPEVARERKRWSGSYAGWQRDVKGLRSFITKNDHIGSIIDALREYISLTAQERETYFGRWSQ